MPIKHDNIFLQYQFAIFGMKKDNIFNRCQHEFLICSLYIKKRLGTYTPDMAIKSCNTNQPYLLWRKVKTTESLQSDFSRMLNAHYRFKYFQLLIVLPLGNQFKEQITSSIISPFNIFCHFNLSTLGMRQSCTAFQCDSLAENFGTWTQYRTYSCLSFSDTIQQASYSIFMYMF